MTKGRNLGTSILYYYPYPSPSWEYLISPGEHAAQLLDDKGEEPGPEHAHHRAQGGPGRFSDLSCLKFLKIKVTSTVPFGIKPLLKNIKPNLIKI